LIAALLSETPVLAGASMKWAEPLTPQTAAPSVLRATRHESHPMIERALELGSPDLPVCQCKAEMDLVTTEKKGRDIQLKIFRCSSCQHEMRLMVWSEESIPV
jgi:hypothetical protein